MSFFVAFTGWRLRKARGGFTFSIMALGISFWSLGYLLGFFNTNLEWKMVMLRVEYLGNVVSVYFWIVFVATYTQYDRWLTKSNRFLLALIPIVTYLQILFIENHQLFYESLKLRESGDLVVTAKVYGFGFYLWSAYAYLVVIGGALLLVRGILHQPNLFRNQAFPLSAGSIAVFIPNLLYVTGNNPIAPYDPTPLFFIVAEVMFLVAIWRYRLFDLVPIAHHFVFSNVKSGVIIADDQMRIVEMNPFAEKIFNLKRKKILGKPFPQPLAELYESLNPKDVEGRKAELTLGPASRTFEVKFDQFAGSSLDKKWSIVLLYDITDLKQTMRELDAYARMVAHDLKSPLAAQLNALHVLENVDIKDTERQVIQAGMKANALKMNQIIESLLILASVRNEKEISLRKLDMGDIVGKAIQRLQGLADEKQAKISTPEAWPKAFGYAPWVEVIWVNLISNAIKYGGNPPRIEVGHNKDRYWVKDGGGGLSSAEREVIFEEFHRLKRHENNTPGHGIGLSIIKRIIKRMGGRVGVESDSSGSTFYFTLPKDPKA